MSSSAMSDWDDSYARLARAASQLRTTGSSTLPAASRSSQAASIQAGLDRLNDDLRRLPLSPAEAGRRRGLLDGLRRNLDGGAAPSSASAAALRQQDDMIDELAVGVGRLKNQTQLIHQEANSHVRLLDEMETNVDLAHEGMEQETRRAAKLREDRSVWRLYLVIAGLSVLLFLLILMGLS